MHERGQPVAESRDGRAHVGQRQLAPPREVPLGRRPVAGEVTQGEGVHGVGPFGQCGRRDPFVDEHERLLGRGGRTPADHAELGQVVDDVVAALAVGRDAARGEQLQVLVAGQAPATREGLAGDECRAIQRVPVEAECSQPRGHRPQRPRGGDREQPAQVVGRDEMQRPRIGAVRTTSPRSSAASTSCAASHPREGRSPTAPAKNPVPAPRAADEPSPRHPACGRFYPLAVEAEGEECRGR